MLKLPIDRLLKLCKDYKVMELYDLYGHYIDGFFEACLFTQDSRYFIGLIDLIQVKMISYYGGWLVDKFNLIKIDDFGRLVYKHSVFPKTNLIITPSIPISLKIVQFPLDTFTKDYKNYINLLLRKMYLYEQTQEINNELYVSFKRSEESNEGNEYYEMMSKLNYQLQDEIEELCRDYPIDCF